MNRLLISSVVFFFAHTTLASTCKDILTRTAPNRIEAALANNNPATLSLKKSYLELAAFIGGTDQLPGFIGPQSLIYILESFSSSHQARVATLLGQALVVLKDSRTTPVDEALKAGGDPEMFLAILEIDTHVRKLKKMHKSAVKLALENHDGKGQQYGDYPYSTHLRNVRGVLKEFGYGPKESVLGLTLGTAAWLHDIVEDTSISLEAIEAAFGKYIADIVANLTNEGDQSGLSKDEQKRITFERVARRPESRIIKLADRITNVEESLTNDFLGRESRIGKYRAEWPLFKKIIHRPGEAEAMWTHLERLLTDTSYSHQFVLFNALP